MLIFWLTQMTPHTFKNMVMPRMLPHEIESSWPCLYSSPATAHMIAPVTKVAAAAMRNHHSARQVTLSNASVRAPADSSAYAGTWTKLKKYSRPIQATPTKMCA